MEEDVVINAGQPYASLSYNDVTHLKLHIASKCNVLRTVIVLGWIACIVKPVPMHQIPVLSLHLLLGHCKHKRDLILFLAGHGRGNCAGVAGCGGKHDLQTCPGKKVGLKIAGDGGG